MNTSTHFVLAAVLPFVLITIYSHLFTFPKIIQIQFILELFSPFAF